MSYQAVTEIQVSCPLCGATPEEDISVHEVSCSGGVWVCDICCILLSSMPFFKRKNLIEHWLRLRNEEVDSGEFYSAVDAVYLKVRICIENNRVQLKGARAGWKNEIREMKKNIQEYKPVAFQLNPDGTRWEKCI